ncbi:MAG: TolC family outer membrane protein [Gammaproteobacteria bacterium]|jgi:outer membrane protein, adhesin transport system|nr:TolC family outer membrane protein [Gammaproteobacteria bacterium]
MIQKTDKTGLSAAWKRAFSMTVLVGLLSAPSVLHAHTLSQAIHLALRNNPEVKSAYYGVGIADEQLGQAKAGWMPTVDLTLDAGQEYRHKSSSDATKLTKKNTAVTITQPLFDGGATAAAVGRSDQMLEISSTHLDEIRTTVTLQAIEAWYEIFRLQRVIQWTTKNVDEHQDLYVQIQKKVEAGGAGKAELVAAETPWLAAKSALISARGQYKDSISRYVKVVGLAPTEVLTMALEIPEGALPAEYEAALTVLLANNPILKSAQANLKAVKSDFDGTRAGLLPTLDFELKSGRDLDSGGNKGQEDYYTALLKLNYNLYRGGADQSRRREIAKSVVDSQEQLNLARQNMEEQLALYWNGLDVTHQLLTTSRKQLDIATENSASMEEQFKLGEADVMTIMAAGDALLQAKLAVLQDETSSRIGVYRIIAHMGVLLDHLEVSDALLSGFDEVEETGNLLFFERLLKDPTSVVSTLFTPDMSGGVSDAADTREVEPQPLVAKNDHSPSWDNAYVQMKNAGWTVLNAVDEVSGGEVVAGKSPLSRRLKPTSARSPLMLTPGNRATTEKQTMPNSRLKRVEQRKMMLANRMGQYDRRSGSYSRKLDNRSRLLSNRKADLRRQKKQFNRELDKYNLNSSRKTGNWVVSN